MMAGQKGNTMKQINSRSAALKFYKGITEKTIIPLDSPYEYLSIRIYPGKRIAVVHNGDLKEGTDWLCASRFDSNGGILYRYRKYVNAYLKKQALDNP